MKQSLSIIIIVLAVISLSSCQKIVGDGPVITETRSTTEFTAVNFSVPGEITFVPSDHYEILIEAQRNIVQAIETYVNDNELKVKVRNNAHLRSSEEIRIIVKAPSVNSLSLSGSGNLSVPNTLTALHTKLVISGSGRMSLNHVEASELETNISGSGSIEIFDGSADHEEITISGSGSVNILGVNANKATTHTSGSGSIRLFVNDELDTHISGSGDVYYKGQPRINLSVSGSGKVLRLD